MPKGGPIAMRSKGTQNFRPSSCRSNKEVPYTHTTSLTSPCRRLAGRSSGSALPNQTSGNTSQNLNGAYHTQHLTRRQRGAWPPSSFRPCPSSDTCPIHLVFSTRAPSTFLASSTANLVPGSATRRFHPTNRPPTAIHPQPSLHPYLIPKNHTEPSPDRHAIRHPPFFPRP